MHTGKENPKVSIIILNYNNCADTKECIDSLGRITYPNYEIIMIDNGSTNGSGERLRREFSQHTFIQNEDNLGFAGGNNVGIRYALENETDYVLLLNDDTVVDPDFLWPLVRSAEADGRVGIVGPKIYYYDMPNVLQSAGGEVNLWKGTATQLGDLEADIGQHDREREVDYVAGCALLVKKSVCREVGLLDESLFMYWEDVDWCLRARQAGFRIISLPHCKIWHKHRPFSWHSDSVIARFYSTRSRLLFMKKHAKWYHWLTFTCYLVFRSIPKGVCGYLFEGWRGANLEAIATGVLSAFVYLVRGGSLQVGANIRKDPNQSRGELQQQRSCAKMTRPVV